MSATEELRRLLDERGVEYETNDRMGTFETTWSGFTAYQLTPRTKLIMHPTPEQAIAATLGGGECEDAGTRFNAWVCSECKATLLLMFDDYGDPSYSVDGVADIPRYCPNCGKAVKHG